MKKHTLALSAVAVAFALSACAPDRRPRDKPAPRPEPTQPNKPGGPTLPPDGPSNASEPSGPDPGSRVNPVPPPEPPAAPKNPEYAIKIEGKPGYVKSPYDGAGRMIDVRGLPPGTEAECPYTHRTFLVPP